MKRKIFTFLTAAALLVCAILPVSAAGTQKSCRRPCIWYCSPCDVVSCTPCPSETPDVPETPDSPAEPEQPADPEPEAPAVPSEPETPVEPETPPEPDTPVEPEQPAAPDTDAISLLEQQACELVNQQRVANGLEPLTISTDLCVKARIKSQDMLDNHYFDHNSPTYGSPFAMMKRLGISYQSAGENIAMGYQTAQAVVNAWMNSEGHRANILSSRYTAMGIGEVNGYWTQWFIG